MEIDVPISFCGLDEQFGTARLNMLWAIAKQHLPDSELQSLFLDLLIHDEEAVAFERLKEKGEAQDGVQETAVKEKLMDVINTHNLLEKCAGSDLLDLMKKYEEFVDKTQNSAKSVCHVIGYISLWAKILRSGFSVDELEAFKEEILHHENQSLKAYDIIDRFRQFEKDKNLSIHRKPSEGEGRMSNIESYMMQIEGWMVELNQMKELAEDNTNFSKRIERTIKYKRSPEPKGIDLWIEEYKKKLRLKESEERLRKLEFPETLISCILKKSNDPKEKSEITELRWNTKENN